MESVLQPLGLSDTEDALYRALLDQPGSPATKLAQRIGISGPAAREALAHLESMGLVTRTPEKKSLLIPSLPDIALEALVSKREEELARVRVEAAELAERFSHRIKGVKGLSPVELVRGYEATQQQWIQVQRSAKRAVRLFDRPPYVMSPGAPNPEELKLLERGVRYRVIYDSDSFDVDGKLKAALACVDAGEEARVINRVPIKLIVADENLALTHNPQPSTIRDSMVVHQSSLLDALIVLFDTLWEQAAPLVQASSGETHELDEIDARIIAFLASGNQDQAIARRLGLGLRTVRRRVGILMERLGAKTRFETAVRAMRAGWIDS